MNNIAFASPDLLQLNADLGSNDERRIWNAAEIMGEYAEHHPSAIWCLTLIHASSADTEVRQAIATCVLEHILEYHFDTFFDLIENAIQGGDERLRDTLKICWKFGQADLPKNRNRWDRLINTTEPKSGKPKGSVTAN